MDPFFQAGNSDSLVGGRFARNKKSSRGCNIQQR